MYDFFWCLFLITVWWIFTILLFPLILVTLLSRNRLQWLVRMNTSSIAPSFSDDIRRDVVLSFLVVQMRARSDKTLKRWWNILEIGTGTGVNFGNYPGNSHVICVDNNRHYLDYLTESLRNNPQIVESRILFTSAEDMTEIPDESMDCVVSTYTLCAVENVHAVLKEVRRVLKENGSFLFVEPVRDYGNWNRFLQKLASPLVLLYFGYRIDRNLIQDIRSGYFVLGVDTSELLINRTYWCFRRYVSGLATKG